MKCSVLQRCVVVLCLVAFGLGQTLCASIGVRCTDASSNTRIELACVKTAQGGCLTASTEHATDDTHDSDPVAPIPCEDEPLGSQVSATRLMPSRVSLEPVVAAVVVAVLWDHWSFVGDQPVRLLHSERDRDRPPDSLAHLRSVILIV
jgi:hypothetical protein